MCGIVGFTGRSESGPVGAACAVERILDGLSKLEYRGYDSAGVSLLLEGRIETVKSAGRLAKLAEKVSALPQTKQSTCGIGHTRWATHGAATDWNAHPHGTPRLSLVHNGIIENYREIRKDLLRQGYRFDSETDTEVAAKLLDHLYTGDPIAALAKADTLLEGSFAFAILFPDHPGELYGMRKNSPLIIGLGEDGNYIASDISALLEYTRDYYALEEGEIAYISPGEAKVLDLGGNSVARERKRASWSAQQAQKGGFAHFMLKEICEQPTVLEHTLRPRIHSGLPSFDMDALPEGFFARCTRIHIVACGTAMHAGLVGKDLIEDLARLPVEVSLASEFRYRNPILPEGSLVVAISQSGETADTLAALRLAKARGVRTLAIVNVPGSTLSREADMVLYTHAGPEISVASTKAFMVQMGLLYLVAIEMGRANARMDNNRARALTGDLLAAVDSMEEVLAQKEAIRELAEGISGAENVFFIGRGLDWPMVMEGSLKLKEITYIHSEAYAAGELKHGAISLIVEGMPVVALGTQEALLPKMISNIQEVNARGGRVLFLCRASAGEEHGDVSSSRFLLPDLDDRFMPIPSAVALQLLAYYAAVKRGCDVDKPRNLAKSVTVE